MASQWLQRCMVDDDDVAALFKELFNCLVDAIDALLKGLIKWLT